MIDLVFIGFEVDSTELLELGLVQFYDKVASICREHGVMLPSNEHWEYDPRKIMVSRDVVERLMQNYKDDGVSREETAMIFLNWGPKVDEDLLPGRVIIYHGFMN